MKFVARVLVIRTVPAVLVIAAAWIGFLRVVKLPVDSNAALVMVWLSALIILLALFPALLNNIKKVKIGEILEIELREAVTESSTAEYTLVDDLAQRILLGRRATSDGFSNCCRQRQFNQRDRS